jgi:thiol-disulfide isomerase/thioredoxin
MQVGRRKFLKLMALWSIPSCAGKSWARLWAAMELKLGLARAPDRVVPPQFAALGILPMSLPLPWSEIPLMVLSGVPFRVTEQTGKVLFLNFWTTWCPSCREEMPAMERLYRRFKDRAFQMAAVDMQERAATVRRFMNTNHFTFPVLLDKSGDYATLLGVRQIPTTFIIDKTGVIIGRAIGPRPWNDRPSVSLFNDLVTGQSAAS